jgi:cysteine desulfurase
VIAKCINAKPHEIIFTSCGTESDNWAIKGAARFRTSLNSVSTSV